MSTTAARLGPTREQACRALDRANEVRVARAALKHHIALREVTVPDVLRAVPVEAQTMTIAELLASQPRWGQGRTLKLLRRHQISELKPVGALTERQRRVLVGALVIEAGERRGSDG